MPLSESIEKNILELEEKERLRLLHKLLDSLEPEIETDNNDHIDKWLNEAETRYQAWKTGEMKTVSEEVALRELRKNTEDDH